LKVGLDFNSWREADTQKDTEMLNTRQ